MKKVTITLMSLLFILAFSFNTNAQSAWHEANKQKVLEKQRRDNDVAYGSNRTYTRDRGHYTGRKSPVVNKRYASRKTNWQKNQSNRRYYKGNNGKHKGWSKHKKHHGHKHR